MCRIKTLLILMDRESTVFTQGLEINCKILCPFIKNETFSKIEITVSLLFLSLTLFSIHYSLRPTFIVTFS